MSDARRNRGKGRNMTNFYSSPLWDKKEPEAKEKEKVTPDKKP